MVMCKRNFERLGKRRSNIVVAAQLAMLSSWRIWLLSTTQYLLQLRNGGSSQTMMLRECMGWFCLILAAHQFNNFSLCCVLGMLGTTNLLAKTLHGEVIEGGGRRQARQGLISL